MGTNFSGGQSPISAREGVGKSGQLPDENPQHLKWWFQVVADTCLSDREKLLWAHNTETGSAGFLALKLGGLSNFVRGGREVTALTSPYTTSYAPGGCSGFEEYDFREVLPEHDLLFLDCLPANELDIPAMERDLRRQGYWVSSHRGFENWYEDIIPGDFAAYWQRRPSKLKNTEKRKRRQAERDHEFKVEIYPEEGELEDLIQDYLAIYRRSWKEAEPDPDFMPEMMRAAARHNALRLGVLYLNGQPAAAQVWLMGANAATIFKLAYDDSFSKYSPGTLLTRDMAEYVIERDKVAEIDYGRGPDAYKKDWLSQCRYSRNLLAFSRTGRGFIGALRHVWMAAFVGWLRRKLNAAQDR